MVFLTHPDKHPGDRQLAKEHFQAVQTAYAGAVLKLSSAVAGVAARMCSVMLSIIPACHS
jgi:DnaJ-class molecular chaperone